MNGTMTMQAQTKVFKEIEKDAQKRLQEFEEYLDDLRLFSNPEFWKALEEVKHQKPKKNFKEYMKKMGF